MRRGLALTLLLLAGCANDPVRYGNSNNKAVHADLLFEQEGCKVYRFEDSGEPHYYVVCESGNATATTELSYMAGKVVMHRADEIPTVKLIPPQKWRAPEPVASLEEPTPPPQKKQKAKKECEDDNLNSFSNGFAQYKCAGGKWVVDDEAMKSLAKMETHKHELQWQLQTCVLGEESMKEVQSYGPMLFAPGSMQQYFQADIDRRFNAALGLQNQLRAEHAASCQAKQPVASIEEPK